MAIWRNPLGWEQMITYMAPVLSMSCLHIFFFKSLCLVSCHRVYMVFVDSYIHSDYQDDLCFECFWGRVFSFKLNYCVTVSLGTIGLARK